MYIKDGPEYLRPKYDPFLLRSRRETMPPGVQKELDAAAKKADAARRARPTVKLPAVTSLQNDPTLLAMRNKKPA